MHWLQRFVKIPQQFEGKISVICHAFCCLLYADVCIAMMGGWDDGAPAHKFGWYPAQNVNKTLTSSSTKYVA